MEIRVRADPEPDIDLLYHHQFEIYREAYLIWDRETWEEIAAVCDVYRIEVDGEYAGDIIFESRGKGGRYIVDLSILPRYQGKGVGKRVLELIKRREGRITAVTRKETLDFFLKSGFVQKRRMKSYYSPGVDGYYLEYSHSRQNSPDAE